MKELTLSKTCPHDCQHIALPGWKTIWGTASSPLKGTLRDHFLREKETFRGLISKQKGTSKKNYRFRETHFRNATVLVNTVVKSRFKTMDH